MTTNKEAVQFLNALLSNIDAGILSFDVAGRITVINDKAIRYLDIQGTTSSVIDSHVLNYLSVSSLKHKVEKCLSVGRENFRLSNVLFATRNLTISGIKLIDGMLIQVTDITSDVLAKDRATQSLLLGQETERRRLAKEIHDGVGPSMGTLKLQIDTIRRKTSDNDIVASLDRVNEAISEIASDIRGISHDLMPSSLIDFGVVTALSNYTKRISENGSILVSLSCNMLDNDLTRQHELNIYRIVQELVHNAMKHSHGTQIDIELQVIDKTIQLSVRDDGVGMKTENHDGGNGLHNVRKRAQSLQGSVQLLSDSGGGLQVIISLPLKKKKE